MSDSGQLAETLQRRISAYWPVVVVIAALIAANTSVRAQTNVNAKAIAEQGAKIDEQAKIISEIRVHLAGIETQTARLPVLEQKIDKALDAR